LIAEMLQQILAVLTDNNSLLVAKVLANKPQIKQIKHNLRLRHIRELRADIPNSRASSAIYLDLLDAMADVLVHIFNIAHTVQGRSSQIFTSQFSNPHTGSSVQLNLTKTQKLQIAMSGANTQKLYNPMNGPNTSKLLDYLTNDAMRVNNVSSSEYS